MSIKFGACVFHDLAYYCMFDYDFAMQHKSPPPIIGLDIIRFLAACGVMFFHYVYLVSKPGHTTYRLTGGEISFPSFDFSSSLGWIGVEVFFLISGFVISMSAAQSSPRAFFEGRVLRLVPAAWLCATITLIVALSVHDGSVTSILMRYVRSMAFIPFGEQIDGSYWTLGIEISFYACVWFLLILRKWDYFLPFVCALGLVSTGYNIAQYLTDGHLFPNGRLVDLLLLRHGCAFAFGALVYMMSVHGHKWHMAALSLVMLVGVCFELPLQFIAHLDGHYDAQRFLALYCVWGGSVVLFLASVFYNDRILAVIPEAGRRFTRKIGIMTYPLYLIHAVVGSVALYWFTRAGLPSGAALAAVILLVFLLTYFVSMLEPLVRTNFRTFLNVSLDRAVRLANQDAFDGALYAFRTAARKS